MSSSSPITLTYETTPIPIEFGLYSPSTPSTKTPSPLIVWFHAGALFYGGKRTMFPEWLRRDCEEKGWTLLAANYRLLPESGVEDVMQDLKDLWSYIHHDLTTTITNLSLPPIDLSNVFVAGGSAGGYLTLQSGHLLSPPPKALVSLYGYTFTEDSFYATPQPADTVILGQRLGDLDSRAGEIEEFWMKGKEPVSSREVASDETSPTKETMFYHRLIRTGTYYHEVFGIPSSSSLPSHPELHHLFPQTANPSTYPPTFLAHGTVDSAIHCTESVTVAEWLKSKGFEHELVLIEGGEHGFDSNPCEGELERQVREFKRKVWKFLEEKVGRK